MSLSNIYIKILVIIQLLCLSVLGQKKDSLMVKSPVIKDDIHRKKKFTFFVSDRLSEDGKYDVFKVVPTTQAPAIIIVRGHLEVIGYPENKKGTIHLYNASNNEMVGTYNTNHFTGNYLLVLVPGVKYIFKIDVIGYGTLTETIEVPVKIDFEVCQQEVKIKFNELKHPSLQIINFFAEEHEKVFYLKSIQDTISTTPDIPDTPVEEKAKKPSNVKEKKSSTIDELVKKQVEEEKKKPAEALKAFNAKNYEVALTIYNSMLKNDATDPFTNYYYGICLLELNKNKARAINSLQLASRYKEIPYDVFFYLGKACHLSYLFQNAIVWFEEYKKLAKPLELTNNKISTLLRNCRSGSMLITNQVNIEIVKRTDVKEENLLSNYNPDIINDRVKKKPSFFNSEYDRAKQENLLICNVTSREFIHASYGEKAQNGLDLFRNKSNPSGTLGQSQSLGVAINTSLDENYPYVTQDGNTLYFSSKGHNSMGGYDIFKSTRKDSLSPWTTPQNMGYPINSTYDDILFVADSISHYAAFSSNRKNNRFEYIQIKIPLQSNASSIIKGNLSATDTIYKREAFISVYNSNTGELAGIYKINPITGSYLMILPSATKYDVTVETTGYQDLNSFFEVPEKKGEFTLKQTIKLDKKQEKILTINNYFAEEEADKFEFDIPIAKPAVAEVTKKKLDIKKEVKIAKPKRNPLEAQKDAEDLAEANKLYSDANYSEAALIYEALEMLIDLDAENLHNYGMSLFYSKSDKSRCIAALESAINLRTQIMDTYYYLAKANQMSYRFANAIKYYKKYVVVSKPSESENQKIEKEIEHCNNGIKLVNNPVVLEVYEKKHVDPLSIQNSLTHIESGSKVLVITDDMRSSIDKKKNYKSLLYLSPDKNTVMYSSYGEDESMGKDIYMLKKLSNGKWSPVPQNIKAINSAADEEYPALSKDGKVIYFSSKGFENMGGYDIFRSILNEETGEWSAPVNLGCPINSPFEDIYFLE